MEEDEDQEEWVVKERWKEEKPKKDYYAKIAEIRNII